MSRVLFFASIFLLAMPTLWAQEKLIWQDLADVEFSLRYNEKYEVNFLMPTFGDKVKAFDGQRISITGYFLDITGNGDVFLVSANPMASCFFCGAAGPETIIEVDFLEQPPFKTDQVVTVTGIFELNGKNVDRCNYILNEAAGELVN